MKKMRVFLCLILVAASIFMQIPAVHAADTVRMLDMDHFKGENYRNQYSFTDSFDNTYSTATLLDVALGSHLTYSLGGQFSRFTATLTTSKETNSDAAFDFYIVLDGKVAYECSDFTRQSAPKQIDLDLIGVQVMEILTATQCNSYTFLYLAAGQFTHDPNAAAPPAQTPEIHTLSDVTLGDSDCYEEFTLLHDSYGNLRSHNYSFGRGSWEGYAVYNLKKDYDRLTAVLFSTNDASQSSTRCVEIYCDDVKVASYENITRQTKPISIDISLKNVSILKIVSRYTPDSWLDSGSPVILGDCRLTLHSHTQGQLLQDIAPTCTTEGRKIYSCAVCGEDCDPVRSPALGHTPADWTTAREPSCGEPGSRVITCTVCAGVVEQEEIPCIPHTPGGEWETISEASCTQEGSQVIRCQVCTQVLQEQTTPMAEHTMNDWQVVYGSVWDAPIHREQMCRTCGHTEVWNDYALAWVKPLVLCCIILPLLAALFLICCTARLRPDAAKDMKQLLAAWREAAGINGEDVRRADAAMEARLEDARKILEDRAQL